MRIVFFKFVLRLKYIFVPEYSLMFYIFTHSYMYVYVSMNEYIKDT